MVVGLRVFKEHMKSGRSRHRDPSLSWQAWLFRDLLETQLKGIIFVLFFLFLKKKWAFLSEKSENKMPRQLSTDMTLPGRHSQETVLGARLNYAQKPWWLTSPRIMLSFSQPQPELLLHASTLFLLSGMLAHPSLRKWEATVIPMHSPRGLCLWHCNLAILSHSCQWLLSPSLILTS